MQGIRLYLEHDSAADKRKGKGNGCVIAVELDTGHVSGTQYCFEALGSVFSFPNNPVAGTQVSTKYLSSVCKRISEAQAREIHPRLFERLDEDNEREVKA